MHIKKWMFIFVMLCSMPLSFSQPEPRFVLLPESETNHIQLCSRSGPQVEGSWRPDQATIEGLESRLTDLSKLRAAGAPKGKQIERTDMFYRQYLGVIVSGHKEIYINAFPGGLANKDWQRRFVDVCDGGASFWGALYDPQAGKFSDLKVNGGWGN